jgi:hypothetical protein
VEKRRERKWFGEMNMRAFRAFLLSNRTLRMLGMCMGIVGLVDGVIQFSYSRYGVAAFACVLSVYYLYHSRSGLQASSSSNEGNDRVLRRSLLLLMGVCVIEFCLLQIATRTPWLSDSEMLGFVGGWVFVITMCLASLCLFAVILQYAIRTLSTW